MPPNPPNQTAGADQKQALQTKLTAQGFESLLGLMNNIQGQLTQVHYQVTDNTKSLGEVTQRLATVDATIRTLASDIHDNNKGSLKERVSLLEQGQMGMLSSLKTTSATPTALSVLEATVKSQDVRQKETDTRIEKLVTDINGFRTKMITTLVTSLIAAGTAILIAVLKP